MFFQSPVKVAMHESIDALVLCFKSFSLTDRVLETTFNVSNSHVSVLSLRN